MLSRSDVADPDEKTLTQPSINLLSGSDRLSASLIVIAGHGIGRIFRVAGEMVIGRSPDSDIPLEDDGISRHHAKLVKSELGVELHDLGSKNGTRLNGEPLREAGALKNGDKIQLGANTVLRYGVLDTLGEEAQRLLYDSAIRDGLTGAFNRKFFAEALEKDLAFCLRHKAPLAVLMMDVDLFKRVNDTYGHAAGDFALVTIVDTIHRAIRAEDVLARYGGEELALLLREVEEEVAVAVAERLRRLVEQLRPNYRGQPLSLTISIGAAMYAHGQSSEELLAAADRYLLMAKGEGRNRVSSKWLSGR